MYSKKAIERAGGFLRRENLSEEELNDAMTKLSYWRSLHDEPLRKVYEVLQRGLKQLSLSKGLVSFRLKTEQSITVKLKRFPKMSLKTMGDIAGCRVIVYNLKELNKFYRWLKKESVKQKLDLKLLNDYLETPKEDGYRSIHFQIRYEGYKVEIQLRTSFQHSWATCVEVVDNIRFYGSGLKHGIDSRDVNNWRRFFVKLSAYSDYIEKHFSHLILPVNIITTNEQGFLVKKDKEKEMITKVSMLINEASRNIRFSKLVSELKKAIKSCNALKVLNECVCSADAVSKRMKDFEADDKGYILVDVTFHKMALDVKLKYFKTVDSASVPYQDLETEYRKNKLGACYLVATKNVESLRKAYPNFFSDARHILANLAFQEHIKY